MEKVMKGKEMESIPLEDFLSNYAKAHMPEIEPCSYSATGEPEFRLSDVAQALECSVQDVIDAINQ